MTKRTRKWWLLVGGLLVALLVVAIACDDDDEDGGVTPTGETPAAAETPTPAAELQTDFGVTDTEILLGMNIVQSGSLAAVYQPIAPTMQAYFSKVNEEDGGVCGRSITFIVEDDQYSPAAALERARKLVDQDGILAFVGNLGTPPNSGSIAFINDPNEDGDTSDGIPNLWLSSGAPVLNDPVNLPWTFGYIPDYNSEGRILGTHVNDNFAGQTVAILYQGDPFGEPGRDGFTDVFAGEVVAEQSYESTATEITSQLATLRDADPDILYLYTTPAFTAQTFGYMLANEWSPQVVQSYVNSHTTLASLVGGDDGIEVGFQRIAGTISTNYLLDPVADIDEPALVEHARIMETYNGPPVGTLSVYGQSLAELAVETLTIACDNNDMTREGVRSAAESIQGFSTSVLFPGIEINTSSTDHFALQALVPTMIEADGTLTALSDPISIE
jgi:branched-chain amino acid transport system substrate-binding protein